MQIRTLSSDEVKLAVVWAAAEGWNPGQFDAECFYAADPQGFIGAFIDDELVGTISAVRYGDDFSFLGFYIVAPQFRGRGIGTALWAAAMERVSGSAVGLDGAAFLTEPVRSPQVRRANFANCALAILRQSQLWIGNVLEQSEPRFYQTGSSNRTHALLGCFRARTVSASRYCVSVGWGSNSARFLLNRARLPSFLLKNF